MPFELNSIVIDTLTKTPEAGGMTSKDRNGQLLDIAALAKYLRVPIQTIYRWRTLKQGPPAMKLGRHLRWRQTDVDRWLNTLVEPASDNFTRHSWPRRSA